MPQYFTDAQIRKIAEAVRRVLADPLRSPGAEGRERAADEFLFWAKTTGYDADNDRYAWTELSGKVKDGTWQELAGGRSGTTSARYAISWKPKENLPNGTIVLMGQTFGQATTDPPTSNPDAANYRIVAAPFFLSVHEEDDDTLVNADTRDIRIINEHGTSTGNPHRKDWAICATDYIVILEWLGIDVCVYNDGAYARWTNARELQFQPGTGDGLIPVHTGISNGSGNTGQITQWVNWSEIKYHLPPFPTFRDDGTWTLVTTGAGTITYSHRDPDTAVSTTAFGAYIDASTGSTNNTIGITTNGITFDGKGHKNGTTNYGSNSIALTGDGTWIAMGSTGVISFIGPGPVVHRAYFGTGTTEEIGLDAHGCVAEVKYVATHAIPAP